MTRLRDVHAPARFIEGEVHWQMAAGPEAIDVCVTAAALHLLGPRPLPAYLEVFEQYRPILCEIARLKFGFGARRPEPIRLGRDDIASLLSQATEHSLTRQGAEA